MAKIYYADLYGKRKHKFEIILSNDITTIDWIEINPNSPFYLFCPQNTELLPEYNQGFKVTEIFPINGVGMTTARDNVVIDFDKETILKRATFFRNSKESDEEVCRQLNIPLKKGWNIEKARKLIKQEDNLEQHIKPFLYRLFDDRFIFYHDSLIWRTVKKIMRNMLLGDNLGLVCTRQQSIQGDWTLIGVTNQIIESSYISNKTAEINSLFPLYIYPNKENNQGNLLIEKTPNLSENFLQAIKEKLSYIPTPENIFYYIYAVFHSPTYRQRYAEFLKMDFPRLPLTSDDNLFNNLAKLGEELVKLHLMESPKLNKLITKYSGEGESLVSQVIYKPKEERIYISKTRYFSNIKPEIWNFKIGGYQVLDKWLKDRKKANRNLSFDDILHYQKIVVALYETRKLMTEIDKNIGDFPIK